MGQVFKNCIELSTCSNNCVLNDVIGEEGECEILFAGFSKNHNKGIKYRNKFYIERLAESWDGEVHDYGVTIKREQVVKDGIILQKLMNTRHPNLLRIEKFCNCSVVVEYIDGYLLNAKKEKWLLGPHAYEEDFTDICSTKEIINVFTKICDVLINLHKNGISHTDPIDHNVMIEKSRHNPILIDLIGSMPLTNSLEVLDKYVFLNRLILPISQRINIVLSDKILGMASKKGLYELSGLYFELLLIG